MLFRKNTIFVLFFLVLIPHIFSQQKQAESPNKKTFPEGLELSQSTFSILSKEGFSPVRQELSLTGQDSLAYNIILSFERTTKNSDEKIPATNLIFCFTQEDFYENKGHLLDFLRFLSKMKRDWTAQVLFSALDEPLLSAKKNRVWGTEVFAQSLEDTELTSAIAVAFNKDSKSAIHTGSLRHTSPLWLTRKMAQAFFDNHTTFSFKDTLSAIYRIGLLKAQERLSFFFENEIPAIQLSLSSEDQIKILETFAASYTPSSAKEWEMHYIYINGFSLFSAFFMREKSIIITCLIVGMLTLFILCAFSFLGKNGERHKYEFIRSSYMIPLTLALSLLSLYLGQKIAGSIASFLPLNPIVQYGIKIVFSLVFISVLFVVQELLKISAAAFIYGYILFILAVFNIFLFTTQDLTLFVLFATEYIIIYLSRNSKRLFSLSVFFTLMILPFIPYAFIIIRNASDAELISMVHSSIRGNIMLAFGIFPFQITWLRILVLLNVRAGSLGFTMKKLVAAGIFSLLIILTFISALIFLVSHFVYRPDFRKSHEKLTKIIEDDRLTMQAKLSQDEFSGMTTNHIRISSEEEAVRYEVELKGSDKAHPIYDSIYNYTIITDSDGSDSYSFTIPDYPPKKITIDYAAPSKTDAIIEVTAYYKTEKPDTFRTEKRELRIEQLKVR